MDPLKRYEAAIEAAGDAGDLEAVRELGQAMQQQLRRSDPSLGMPEKFKPGQSGMRDSIRSVVKEQPRQDQIYAGAGSALALAGLGLSGKDSTDPNVQNWRSLATASPDAIGGNLAGTVGLFGAAPSRLGAEATGMAMSRVPPWLAGRFGATADTAVTGGILNAAATPGTGPERIYEGMFGAAGGTIPALYATGAAGRRAVTAGGKRVAVGEGVLTEAGDKADELISKLGGADPAASIGVRSTAAMKTQDPMLQTLESGSRAKRGDLWKPVDQRNAKARWDALVAKAGTPEELEGMTSTLNKATGEARENALDNAHRILVLGYGETNLAGPLIKPLEKKLADWRFKHRPNKDVQALANYIEGEIKVAGTNVEQLYEVRKVLTDGIKPGRNDELSNAIKSARKQRVEAIGLIDDALDTLSGGGWREYLSKHSQGMKPIESKQALQDIVGSLERGMPAGVVPPAMGESAAWKTVGTLRDRFGQKELGKKTVETLLPEDKQLVDSIVDSLKRQADSMTSKATLGSPTAPLIANAGRADAVSRSIVQNGVANLMPGGDILASKVFDKLGRQGEEELARLLQDPDAMAEAIAAAIRARRLQAGASKAGAASGAASGNQ